MLFKSSPGANASAQRASTATTLFGEESFISPARIDLTEFKRRYTATFTNEFIPDGEGMCYRITGIICLRWPYKLMSLLLKPIVVARMRRFIVDPLKGAAERNR